ncbi:hypothetical protein MXB_5247 [Myxobolus squamalis]|nr:hypothetical protein MXB_5247 [Myxobolus squamalis]
MHTHYVARYYYLQNSSLCLGIGSWKNRIIYFKVLHILNILLDYAWMPSFEICNVEKTLINAFRNKFKETRLVRCYFHLRQALQPKMQNLEFLSIKVPSAMNPSKS